MHTFFASHGRARLATCTREASDDAPRGYVNVVELHTNAKRIDTIFPVCPVIAVAIAVAWTRRAPMPDYSNPAHYAGQS